MTYVEFLIAPDFSEMLMDWLSMGLPEHGKDNFVIGDADLDTGGADKPIKTSAKRKPWRTPLVIVPTPVKTKRRILRRSVAPMEMAPTLNLNAAAITAPGQTHNRKASNSLP